MLEGFDPNQIQDVASARQAIVLLLNLVENRKQENEQLRAENRRLEDYNQQLKGEQGKPKIKANRPKPQKEQRDHSSERERHSVGSMRPALDERIALTTAKKGSLLMVLLDPEMPLHNNPAELGARQRVRQRNISKAPRTAAGAKAWDTFMTLAATAKKLGVSFYAYIRDRISGADQIPDLAKQIDKRAQEHPLGASWAPP